MYMYMHHVFLALELFSTDLGYGANRLFYKIYTVLQIYNVTISL